MQWVNEERLREVLAHIRNNPHSKFYDRKYAGHPVDGSHFFELPLLTRAELQAAPVQERTFCAPEDIRFAAFTSGTTSKEPLVIPFSKVENYYFEPSLGTGIRRPLIIHPPMMRAFAMTFVQQCEQAAHKVAPLFGDLQSMQNSAMLAAIGTCDAVYSIPTLAAQLAPAAVARGIAATIKLLALSSEVLTTARRAELQTAFPHALIANLYGSAELGQMPFFTCTRVMERGENHFHFLTKALAALEIIDGELVITYGLNRATPLLRYKTGDYFEEVGEGCDCGLPGPVVRWSHRSGVDRVRLNGMEFDAEAADRALSAFPHLATLPYQVHFYPTEGSSAITVVLELATAAAQSEDLASFAERELPDAWRLSATATLRTALERGLVASFTAKAVPALSVGGVKAKRFVNHVV